MSEELLFTVAGSAARLATPITLAEAGLKERSDLQEWVMAHPAILGSDVKIVAFEFDRWSSATGPDPQDRLDVLGLSADGRLVVAELKRDRAPDTTQLQAIKYAAMASRFSPETLAGHYARYLRSRGRSVPEKDALLELQEHAPELSVETLRRPRIVLVARQYPPQVTASAVWLSEMGLDIALVQFQAYRAIAPAQGPAAGEQVLVSVSRLYPLPDIEEFMVSPERQLRREASESTSRVRENSAVALLVDAGEIELGAVLIFAPTGEIDEQTRTAVEEWIAEDPKRGTATWCQAVNAPLRWALDGQQYSPTGLAVRIVREASGVERNLWGTQWWRDAAGWTLVQLAAPLRGGRGALYERFWARWIERVQAEHPQWSNARVPQRQSWITVPSPVKGTVLGNSFAINGRLRSELYMDGADAAGNMAVFDTLQASSDELHRAYGRELAWESLPGKKACRIADYTSGDVTDIESHEAYIDWFFDAGARLRAALAAIGYPE